MFKKYVEEQKSIRQQLDDIHEREAWTRGRFDDNENYHTANTEFQDWVRGRFDDNENYHTANTEFQDWVRGRFDDNENYHTANTEFQDWVRGRFDDNENYHTANTEFQDWVRKKFEEDERYHSVNAEFQDWVKEKVRWITEHMGQADPMVCDMTAGNIGIQKNFYQKRTYSQAGEDAIISYVFHFLGMDLKKIRYLELGANHAKEMSNTYAYYENGASGVLVEANPELIEELRRIRPRDTVLHQAIVTGTETEVRFYVMSGDGLSTVSHESAAAAMQANRNITVKAEYMVQAVTLNALTERYFPDGLDLLSIDLEGIEEEILESLDLENFRPLVIVLENIPYQPYLVINEREDKAGRTLRGHAYVEYAFTGINSIYLDKIKIDEINRGIMERAAAQTG